MKIKAILFDIDGTLYQGKDLFWPGLKLVFKHWPWLKSFRKTRKYLHKHHAAALEAGVPFVDFQADYQAALRGKGETREQILTWRNRYLVDFDWIFNTISPAPYVVDFLKNCQQKKLKLGLLSDFPLCKKIERLGLSGFWQVQMCTEDVGALKPNPKAFLQAACRIQEKPEDILYIGDSYPFDIMGAKAAGMKTAHYTRCKKRSQTDVQFCDYRQLIRQLDEWL